MKKVSLKNNMSYCKKIDIKDINEVTKTNMNKILDKCERSCNRYYQCDTAAFMLDVIKKEVNMK